MFEGTVIIETSSKYLLSCALGVASAVSCLPFAGNQIKFKSSLYSPYCAEACDELRGPSPRLRAWATQLQRNVATVASRWRHCVDLTGWGIEPQISRTDSVRVATELTAVVPFLLRMNFACVLCFKACEIVLSAGCCTYEAQNLRLQLCTWLTQQKQLLHCASKTKKCSVSIPTLKERD